MSIAGMLKAMLRRWFVLQHHNTRKGEGRSLLCNNCTGGVILHELGFRFDTPTINTWIPDGDFLRFVENIAFYKKQQMMILPNQKDYVLACLGDVQVHFMHETDPEKAVAEWQRRFSRMDEKNVYCLFVAGEKTSAEEVKKATKLPFKNICILTENS